MWKGGMVTPEDEAEELEEKGYEKKIHEPGYSPLKRTATLAVKLFDAGGRG